MKATWLVAAVSLASLLGPATANDNVTGLGGLPCQSAIALADREDYRERLAQWAGGFVSGLNQAAPAAKRRNLSKVEPESLARDIIAGCRVAEPGEPIAAIVIRHLATLPGKR